MLSLSNELIILRKLIPIFKPREAFQMPERPRIHLSY